MTAIAYILVFGLLGSLAVSVMYGLYWAIKQGQFANFERGATCIFDDEEPLGSRTDAFPDEQNTTHSPRGNQAAMETE